MVKRTYLKVDDEMRYRLIEMVHFKKTHTIKQAAQLLEIKYASAKKICRKYQEMKLRSDQRAASLPLEEEKEQFPLSLKEKVVYKKELEHVKHLQIPPNTSAADQSAITLSGK